MYNIRVYGLLVNEQQEVLVSDEFRMGMNMTKFPGGGLEAGEGLIDCLKREWQEELNATIEIEKHFYTTDYYVKSAFNSAQLISVYYLIKTSNALTVKISKRAFDFDEIKDGAQQFRWIKIKSLKETDFTFPIDKRVAEMLKNNL
ncbi:MAG: NUDIX hydrolase [Bacteroidetes bacterium]|nr:NUDIX hydrolase [Bacteroidota bacterium]